MRASNTSSLGSSNPIVSSLVGKSANRVELKAVISTLSFRLARKTLFYFEECIPWEFIPQHWTLLADMASRGKHFQPQAGPEKAFGQAFRSFRKGRGISQERVSFEAGCDRTTISLIERGVVSPKLETIAKMCRAIHAFPSVVMRRMERSRYYR